MKCRSMTTKEEFVEMWNKEEKKYESEGLLEDLGIVNKKYYVYFGHNAIKCTSYQFSPSGEYVGLLYGDERIGYKLIVIGKSDDNFYALFEKKEE